MSVPLGGHQHLNLKHSFKEPFLALSSDVLLNNVLFDTSKHTPHTQKM